MGENTSRVKHTDIGYELTHVEYHGSSTHDLDNLITGRGASQVVASSDALNPGNADHAATGDADDVDIQAALDALPT